MRCWRLPRYDYKNNKNHSVFVFLFRSIASWPSLTFFFSASRHFFFPVRPSSFSLILLFPSSRPSPFQPLQTLRSVILDLSSLYNVSLSSFLSLLSIPPSPTMLSFVILKKLSLNLLLSSFSLKTKMVKISDL